MRRRDAVSLIDLADDRESISTTRTR